MDIKRQILAIWQNLLGLDRSRKIALAAVFATIFLGTVGFGTMMSRATFLPLYSSLPVEDVNSISRLLAQNHIEFNSNHEKGTVEVAPENLAQARILLAEQGLPTSKASGYDLFDQVNTFGLTSFMQDVTNKRAIEGELVRTLRMIDGITAARVHLVMPEKNAFRRDLNGQPTASVMIKSTGNLADRSIFAVRNIVSAAVPGLGVDNVTVVDASGATIAVPGDETGRGTSKLIEYENMFERDLTRKIATAVGPFLGESNYRVSVTAKLNNDQTRKEEKRFDPDSRVARSEQTVREESSNENRESDKQVSVQQNLPEESPDLPGNQISRESEEKREETINYEINEQKIETQSDGYKIEALSVALVVNNQRVRELLGDKPDPAEVDKLKAELERIVTAAISTSDNRGDKVEISMVDFIEDTTIDSEAGGGISALLALHLGSIVNAAGMIVVALVLTFTVLRPLTSFVTSRTQPEQNEQLLEASVNPNSLPQQETDQQAATGNLLATKEDGEVFSAIERLDAEGETMTRLTDQLNELVARGEDRVAAALQRWLSEDEATLHS